MAEAVDENTAIVWICNPNNPTGTLIASDKIKAFVEKVPNDVLIVLDEAYTEYITDETYEDSIHLLEKHPNVLIMRTFSKAYGLASFRVGYAIGSEEVISQLEPTREPFNNTVIKSRSSYYWLRGPSIYRMNVKKKIMLEKHNMKHIVQNAILHFYPFPNKFYIYGSESR